MIIEKLNADFSVCKVIDYTRVNFNAKYCFIGKTDRENSLVCLTEDVPCNAVQREDGWRGFQIAGVLDFSLVGILAKISSLLAEGGISLFALSTFDTDTVLVKQESFEKALSILAEAGYTVSE